MKRIWQEKNNFIDVPTIPNEEWDKAKAFLMSFFEQLDKDLLKDNKSIADLSYPVDSTILLLNSVKTSALLLCSKSENEVEIMQRMLFHSRAKLSNKYKLRVLAGAFSQLYRLGKRIEGLPKILPN